MARKVRKSSLSPSRWASVAVLLILVAATAWAVQAVRVAEVNSESMEPTIAPGDFLLMRIDAYRSKPPARGDIVFFRDTSHHGELLVKRVIGVPGDTLFVRGGTVWVNDQLIEESYIKQPYLARRAFSPTLGEDEFWVMGDNRQRSSDSREFGPIRRAQIVGQAAGIIYPPPRRQHFSDPYEG